MVFKLIRTDADANCTPCKIQLPQGSHLIGRGNFLECEDKRVSRKHGELTVTEDCILMKALHQNPCFFIKKGTSETQLLKQNFTIELCNGDRFGLLPHAFWFEVIYCPFDIIENDEIPINEHQNTIPTPQNTTPTPRNTIQTPQNTICTEENTLNVDNDITRVNENGEDRLVSGTETEVNEELIGATEIKDERNSLEIGTENAFGDDEDLINFDMNETLNNVEREGSPSMIQAHAAEDREPLPSPSGERVPSPAPNVADAPSSSTQQCQVPPPVSEASPSKRSHSLEATDVKRVKTEPVEVEQEPVEVEHEPVEVKQEPVTDQNGPDVNPGPSRLAAPNADPPPAPPGGRERCWYGASCYRKNPVHKAQFSHPTDSDWGVEDRIPCPYGRACRKADPRHWRDHSHPPEARPPGDRDRRPAKKRNTTQKRKRDEDESEEDSPSPSPVEDLIVTGKRQRKPVRRDTSCNASDLESDNEDPYDTDGSDEWVPGSQQSEEVSTQQSQSQDFTTQDI